MRKVISIFIVLMILQVTFCVLSCSKPEEKEDDITLGEAPEPSGQRLRSIVTSNYSDGSIIIGATTGAWSFGTPTGEILDREFNYVTPENDFKQWNIHPDNSDNWNWIEADA